MKEFIHHSEPALRILQFLNGECLQQQCVYVLHGIMDVYAAFLERGALVKAPALQIAFHSACLCLLDGVSHWKASPSLLPVVYRVFEVAFDYQQFLGGEEGERMQCFRLVEKMVEVSGWLSQRKEDELLHRTFSLYYLQSFIAALKHRHPHLTALPNAWRLLTAAIDSTTSHFDCEFGKCFRQLLRLLLEYLDYSSVIGFPRIINMLALLMRQSQDLANLFNIVELAVGWMLR